MADEGALARRLPEGPTSPDDLLDRFLGYVGELGLELYPAQEEALLEIASGKHVVLNTPTGSGKSLVALFVHFKAIAEGRRSFYTAPIKALASEKFFDLCDALGPTRIGMMTGDASINRDAPVICCTAEVLANMALREGSAATVDYAVVDEFHYYADKERGVAWQVPLLSLPQATFLLMSATLGPTELFEKDLEARTGKPVAAVKSATRPVPLDFEYRETPIHETIQDLVAKDLAPVYIVHFTQRAAAETAQDLMSVDVTTREEKKAITSALSGIKWSSPYGKDVQRFLKQGIGLHHAGLLPKYRLLVERLAQRGLLRIICGTDTLGVGVNIPIRTVLFTRLCKFDGEKTAILSARDFHQIAGRAGRKGFDDRGLVAVQAPEHVIENLRLEAKAGGDRGKLRRIVRKKPPDKGYVHWDRATFDRLVRAQPEPLISRFQVTNGMLLNVLSRGPGGCRAMKRLIRSTHDPPAQRRRHGKDALTRFRALVESGIVELARPGEGGGVRVNTDLQEDFSIHHALSLWLLETLAKLDPESGTYPLDLMTLVESILENPDLVLARQLDRLKTEKLAELKAAGVEYEERMAELDKLEYPKPLRELVYDTFNDFRRRHPWVGGDDVRPKSIAREMYEQFASFSEYVRDLGVQRAEGVLLRYLSDAYKTLLQTVPALAKTEPVDEMILWLGELVRGVDASLLDEWERMQELPRNLEGESREAAAGPFDVTADARAFTKMVRNETFRVVRALARRDWEEAAEILAGGESGYWTAELIQKAMTPYWDDHRVVRTDPAARSPEHTRIEERPASWRIAQVLLDDEESEGEAWVVECAVDLARAREAGRPVLELLRIGP